MSTRVLFVGLEAMEPTLISHWTGRGLLPNIGALMAEASASRIEFDGATENVATWSSLISGAPMGEHGIFELFGWDADNYQVTCYDVDRDFPLTPFWVHLGGAGRKVSIIDFPRTPLRAAPNVVQVADWMAHYRTEPFRATDPELENRFRSLYASAGRRGDFDSRLYDDPSIQRALEWLGERIEIKTRAVLEHLEQRDWDLYAVNFTDAHDAGHWFWAIHDPTHPWHDPVVAETVGDPLLEVYQQLDAALGALLQTVDRDTVTMLYTATGMEPNYSGNGLLDYFLGRLETGRVDAFFDRTAFELRNHPASGAIRINLKGRESRGRVDPADYDRFCDDLAGRLLELVEIDSGEPAVKYVVKRRERYPGSRSDALPDLMAIWNRDHPIRGFVSPVAGKMDFGSFRPRWSGDHSANAMLYVHDPRGGEGRTGEDATISRFEEFPALIGRCLDVDLQSMMNYPRSRELDAGMIRRRPPMRVAESATRMSPAARLFHHPHWSAVAALPEGDLREALITGYKDGKPFSAHNYHFFEPGAKARRLLDFGCGIGRNFSALRKHAREIAAFDLPEMIEACRRMSDWRGIELHCDWNAIAGRRFDVAVATLVFQHIEEPDSFDFVLDCLSRTCDFLYISSRCWVDGEPHRNVCEAVLASGRFEYVKGTASKSEALALAFPDDTHVDLLLRNRDPAMRDQTNDALFGLHEMVYRPSALRLPITLTQLFTPNYDHFAFKVLENKRRYCDRHGYGFHYRRGLFDHAQDRHPSWHRIPLLLELFEDPAVEWVFWSDIDSLILRQDVRLECFIEPHVDRDVIVPNQGAGLVLGELVDECLCFGQFFVRNSDWSRRFLEAVWAFPREHRYPEYIEGESWEQEAVNFIHRNDLLDFSRHAAIVPNRLFNSFYHSQYREGDFLIHFAGEAARGAGKREALIDEYLGRV